MCYCEIVVYRYCKHPKSEEITPCSHGLNTTTNRCNAGFGSDRIIFHDKPSYCPPCYRRKESDIFATVDTYLLEIHTETQNKKKVQANMEQKHRIALEANKDNPQRLEEAVMRYEKLSKDIVSWIPENEQEVVKCLRSRSRRLKDFRDAQGVWGDG